jgi:hypothetical protein
MPPSRATLVDRDAREFACYTTHGGWRTALLVARNVRAASPGRPPASRASTLDPDKPKLTASDFAKRSGISRQTVNYYLTAWNAASSDGLVPHSSTIPIGGAPTLPDADRWGDYYRRAKRPTGTHPAPTPSPTPSPSPSTPDPTPTPPGVLAQLSASVKISQRAVAEIGTLLDEVEAPGTSDDLTEAVSRNPLTAGQLRTLVDDLRQTLPELHQRLQTLSDRLDTAVPIPASAPE